MFLERPSFPVSLSEGEAEERVSSMLAGRQWQNPAFSKNTLIFVPYWFFSYAVYREDEKETRLLGSGFNALNAFENRLEPGVAELSKDPKLEKTSEFSEEVPVNVLQAKTGEAEARELIILRIADLENVHRSRVVLSGLELFFVPFWIIGVFLGENEAGIVVNASSGEIINGASVPFREKPFKELTSEALEELSHPLEWLNYSVDLASGLSRGLFGWVKKSPGRTPSFSSYELQLIVLAIIAVLVILWVAYL